METILLVILSWLFIGAIVLERIVHIIAGLSYNGVNAEDSYIKKYETYLWGWTYYYISVVLWPALIFMCIKTVMKVKNDI